MEGKGWSWRHIWEVGPGGLLMGWSERQGGIEAESQTCSLRSLMTDGAGYQGGEDW